LIYTLSGDFFSFLDKFANVKSPALAMIAPPTKGNPAPITSISLDEHRNGRQMSIPKVPKIIAV
jgi:hypothetical protein